MSVPFSPKKIIGRILVTANEGQKEDVYLARLLALFDVQILSSLAWSERMQGAGRIDE
jgi:hypothetical protein